MRATKSGRVLGTAIADMKVENLTACPNDPEGLTDIKCGQVVVFVNLVDYGGMSVDLLMAEANGLNISKSTTTEMVSSCVDSEGVATSTNSEGVCDEGLTLATSTVEVVVESSGIEINAATGTIALDRENMIINYLKTVRPGETAGALESEIFTDRLSAAFEIFTPRVITEGLRTDYISALFDDIKFKSDVIFFGTPYFTVDTAGFAVIKAGTTTVDIKFEREYLEKPIVNASMSTSDGLSSDTNSSAMIQALFGKDIRFLITNATTTGFTIVINKVTNEDVVFNWMALAVRGAKIFQSSTSTPGEIINSDNQQDNNSSTTTAVEENTPPDDNATTTEPTIEEETAPDPEPTPEPVTPNPEPLQTPDPEPNSEPALDSN
jgi:hypothetical protein